MFPSKFVRMSLVNHGNTERIKKIKSKLVRYPLILLSSAGWGLTHLSFYLRKELYFPKFELLLSRGCPFDCKCCIHFISDYKNAVCEPAALVISDMEKLLAAVERIDNVSISGGDAFYYPELYDVVKHLAASEKIGKVSIVVTGAVSPDEKIIGLLANRKIELVVDNYGPYSVKLNEFTSLPYPNINYYGIYDEWNDFGDEKCRNRDNQELDKQYQKCQEERYCLMNGRIYACPRSAHGENHGYFTCKSTEFVDLRNAAGEKQILYGIKELRKVRHLTACNHCNRCTESFNTYSIECRFRDKGKSEEK